MKGDLHDFVAIGLGPFNLGLACLTEPIADLDGVFLEAEDGFAWHHGVMLSEATLQVPFLADLVTMADPSSAYSFLRFLKETGRLYPFYIRESFYPLRQEYDQYCRWAAGQLTSVKFGQRVEAVEYDGEAYVATTGTGDRHRGRRLVVGVGTTPYVPDPLRSLIDGDGAPVVHSASYLPAKERLQAQHSITVIGSGQSAAEVYADLLSEIDDHDYALTWLTRSPRFFPMEYTKLTLELTSPEYTAYFQTLDPQTRLGLLREQRSLHKGISADTINAIFDRLYARGVSGGTETTLLTATEVMGGRRDGSRVVLDLHQTERGERFQLTSDAVILATGYRAQVPGFLEKISDRVSWDAEGRYAANQNYAVDRNGNEIFVQNGEEHTHGFVAPDLGMGAFRNSVIINTMLGREVYRVEDRVAFQEFGVPERFRVQEQAER